MLQRWKNQQKMHKLLASRVENANPQNNPNFKFGVWGFGVVKLIAKSNKALARMESQRPPQKNETN